MMDESHTYNEACIGFRHYSNLSSSARNTLIIQGILLLSASGYLFKTQEYPYVLLSALFGLVFTWFLNFTHSNYQDKAESFIKSACKIERRLSADAVKPIYVFYKHHKKYIAPKETLIVKGNFILMFAAFLILLIAAIFKLGC